MSSEILREIRINPIIPAESVLIATARGNRPHEKIPTSFLDRREIVPECQFCRGNEHLTPPAILHIPDEERWQIRIVRNLYPVFGDEHSLPDINLGIHYIIDGYGQHEVVIDHANHGIEVCDMELSHIALLFGIYRDRMKRLYDSNDSHKYVLVFKNFGPASGGSIAHTHSQIVAMPVIPFNVEMEITNSLRYFREQESCIFCSLIDESLTYETTVYDRLAGPMNRRIEVSRYIVEKGESFVAIKPFASRYPWEIHILPLSHSHDFRTITDLECLDLAVVLRRVMLRLQKLLGDVQYNYFLHSAPAILQHEECQSSFHWHLEICPRTSVPNGFELGSGLAINTISPEKAAEQIRSVVF
jgi:UDPglucose--hexose-1-phosphate uridylyltransferase